MLLFLFLYLLEVTICADQMFLNLLMTQTHMIIVRDPLPKINRYFM